MLELIEEKEAQKVQIFARDQSIEYQQKHIQKLLDSVRQLRQADSDMEQLTHTNLGLQDEITKLKKELDMKENMN